MVNCEAKLIAGATVIIIIVAIGTFISLIPEDHYTIKVGNKVTKVDYCDISRGDLYYKIDSKRKTIANVTGAECINDRYRE